ncbi:hypothetical protein BD309DRAFT_931434 [Dichomitus squalens]|uniref:Uncharacterized protein n=1 Tax=Dichomitus squalens TaxID=114155 RepID=A0A4Q9PAT9_9APHY|nr:hypothetical protein BD309DRAFT_931434 [Dichomitus squalens]TBU51578.1 hypothetical protein BD310DRAFT_890623 [Dichomitus squalens]
MFLNANSSRLPLLNPPTMRSLALPVEVIESVVDCCSEDTYTILAFTLTCRDLHPRSIRVLFTEVRLRNRDRLFALCDVLKARPERQPMVQSLSVMWERFAPFPLLSILPSLRHITFFRSGFRLGGVQCHQSTLLCCRRFGGGLRSLTIRHARFTSCTAFLRFLSAFPSIEDLTCERLIRVGTVEASPLVQKRLSRQLCLRTLNVSAVMVVSVWFLDGSSIFSSDRYFPR